MNREKISMIFKINWIKFLFLNFFNKKIDRKSGYIVPFWNSTISIDKNSKIILENGNLLIGQHSIMAIKKRTYLILKNNATLICNNRVGIGQGAFVHVNLGGKLTIGGGAIGNDSKIGCEHFIQIGTDFLSGREINIRDNDSHIIERLDRKKNMPKPVIIGNHVWVCDRCLILKGSNIGKNVVVGAGAIMCTNVQDNSVAVNKIENAIYPISNWNL